MTASRAYWTLKDKTAVPCSFRTWARMFGSDERRVAYTAIPPHTVVSTVFLGIDHSYGHGPPLLFETCVFEEGQSSNVVRRYATWAEAELGHMEEVEAREPASAETLS